MSALVHPGARWNATDEERAEFLREEQEREDRRHAELRAAGATDDEVRAIVEPEHWTPNRLLDDLSSPADLLAALRQRRAEEADQRRAAYRRALIAAGAPELHVQHVVDVEPKLTPTLEAVRRFVASDALFLVLAGNKGTGKSGAATRGMADYCIPKSHARYITTLALPAAFVTAGKIAMLGGFDKADELARLESVGFLVIDDLGTEHGDQRGWFLSVFGSLVNMRYGNAVKTIITANATIEQLKTSYGERVADRLRETGLIYTFGGPSLRQPYGERHE